MKTIEPKNGWHRFADDDEKLDFLRQLKLIPKTRGLREIFYSGYCSLPSGLCDVVGYSDSSFLVIELDGELHCVHKDCLLDMQRGANGSRAASNFADSTTSLSISYSDITAASADSLGDFVVVDVETTGLKAMHDEIIEISAIRFRNWKPTDEFSSLCKPSSPIPLSASRISGITDDMVAEYPPFSALAGKLINFIGNDDIVGQNLSFDLSFIIRGGADVRLHPERKYYDTLSIARRTLIKPDPEWPLPQSVAPEDFIQNYRLCTLCNHYGISLEGAHRAANDAVATGYLFKCLVEDFSNRPSRLVGSARRKKPSEIKSTNADVDQSSPLYGKSIVFTGELSMSRQEAMQLAVNQGAVLKTSVSRKTDILIVGGQDISRVGDDGLSAKEEKAYELIDKGFPIKIINEDEFLQLVKSEVTM